MNLIKKILIGGSALCVLVGIIFLIFIDVTTFDRILSGLMILFGSMIILDNVFEEEE